MAPDPRLLRAQRFPLHSAVQVTNLTIFIINSYLPRLGIQQIYLLFNYFSQAGDTVRLAALLASETRSQVGYLSASLPFS